MCKIKTINKTHQLNWEYLVEKEPQLADLRSHIKLCRPLPTEAQDFNYEVCWSHFKDRIADLVGWHRRNGHPSLRTQAAYDIAYRTLWHVLHDSDLHDDETSVGSRDDAVAVKGETRAVADHTLLSDADNLIDDLGQLLKELAD